GDPPTPGVPPPPPVQSPDEPAAPFEAWPPAPPADPVGPAVPFAPPPEVNLQSEKSRAGVLLWERRAIEVPLAATWLAARRSSPETSARVEMPWAVAGLVPTWTMLYTPAVRTQVPGLKPP